ncbi:hypothetical protein CRUP_025359 [Coryphaenoides rupestris]|nr:hypothetical protein CRUP_025359 [Coryphaenoides rupestris]
MDSQTFTFPAPKKPQTSPRNTDTQAVSPSARAMLEAVALSGSQVKSQQVGDADLTLEQRREELLHQYKSRPLVFLERYQAHLKPQHLAAFSHLASDARAQHYCRVIQRRPGGGHADRTRVRNHRYAALRALQREGQYFSEEQMRSREPLLYEQYIGQYLTDDEALMQDGVAPDGRGEERPGGPTADEKALLREEFVGQMHQRFLAGQDKDFNYRLHSLMFAYFLGPARI